MKIIEIKISDACDKALKKMMKEFPTNDVGFMVEFLICAGALVDKSIENFSDTFNSIQEMAEKFVTEKRKE